MVMGRENVPSAQRAFRSSINGIRDARRAFRVNSDGIKASCFGERFCGSYRVDNLSATGALLSKGFVPPIGERFSLKLLLPGDEIIEVEAQVVRHHFRSTEQPVRSFPRSLAVSFDGLSSEQADALHDTVADIILREWDPSIRLRC